MKNRMIIRVSVETFCVGDSEASASIPQGERLPQGVGTSTKKAFPDVVLDLSLDEAAERFPEFFGGLKNITPMDF